MVKRVGVLITYQMLEKVFHLHQKCSIVDCHAGTRQRSSRHIRLLVDVKSSYANSMPQTPEGYEVPNVPLEELQSKCEHYFPPKPDGEGIVRCQDCGVPARITVIGDS